MQETNEKLILTFENVYKENSYKDYPIHDLTDLKSDCLDGEMEYIKEDIIANIKNYLNKLLRHRCHLKLIIFS